MLRNPEAGMSYPQRVVANLIFAARHLSSSDWVGNLTGPYDSAALHLRKPYSIMKKQDKAPRHSLPAAPGIPSNYQEADLNFTQATRAASEIGACQSVLSIGDCGAGVLNGGPRYEQQWMLRQAAIPAVLPV